MHKFKVGDKIMRHRDRVRGTVVDVNRHNPNYLYVRMADQDHLAWVALVDDLILWTPLTKLLYG